MSGYGWDNTGYSYDGDDDIATCDNCGQPMHRQTNGGWWVGDDETSECPDSERGHEVNGTFR